MQEMNLRMQQCGFPNAVLHVIGVGDDKFGPFFHHVIHQLGDRHSGSVCGIDLVDVDHFNAWNHFFGIFTAIIMRLAVSPVIIGPNQQQPESKRCFRREGGGG